MPLCLFSFTASSRSHSKPQPPHLNIRHWHLGLSLHGRVRFEAVSFWQAGQLLIDDCDISHTVNNLVDNASVFNAVNHDDHNFA
jgi:hypothetical protein